ncbi:MAG: hypothetical protein J5I90_19600 [Caldilineales bacterium]|nr:hypothetical protein [Caldilineales bacterium]
MNTGKLVRMNRLFSHPSGNLCSIAVDHFIGYATALPEGLRTMSKTINEIVAAQPDAITMHKGIAAATWAKYAGRIPIIIQSSLVRPDDSACEFVATPEDAIRLGADAIAVVAYVYGDTEAVYLRMVSDCVREAARFDLPVICHIYPRDPHTKNIIFAPEAIAWAVHCACEIGVDIVKTPYCGDVSAHTQIAAECTVPLVAAGGPQAANLEAALAMMGDVMRSGARGATIGRNVWGFGQVTAAVNAFKAVIHDGKSAAEAMAEAGL